MPSLSRALFTHTVYQIGRPYSLPNKMPSSPASLTSLVFPNSNYLLFSDSLSSLQALLDPFASNPLTRLTFIVLSTLFSINSTVTFIWIPGHIDLPEHDSVDQAAKNATLLPQITDTRSPPPHLPSLKSSTGPTTRILGMISGTHK